MSKILNFAAANIHNCRLCSIILDGFLRESAVKPVSNMIGRSKENQVNHCYKIFVNSLQALAEQKILQIALIMVEKYLEKITL